jgi:hypothetical protein
VKVSPPPQKNYEGTSKVPIVIPDLLVLIAPCSISLTTNIMIHLSLCCNNNCLGSSTPVCDGLLFTSFVRSSFRILGLTDIYLLKRPREKLLTLPPVHSFHSLYLYSHTFILCFVCICFFIFLSRCFLP